MTGGIIGKTYHMDNIEINYDSSGTGAIGKMNFYGVGDSASITESQIVEYINTNTHPTVNAPTYAIDNRLKEGVYVKYDTFSLPDVEISTELTGYSKKQYACPSKYSKGWRVLSNDGNNVELISEDIVNIGTSNSSNEKKLYLNGDKGLKRGVEALNNVANAYFNNSIATSARCIGSLSSKSDNSSISLVYKPTDYSKFLNNMIYIDFHKMKYSKTSETPGKEGYWMPSLDITIYSESDDTTYGMGYTKGSDFIGIIDIYKIAKNGHATSWNQYSGVRPVITLKNELEVKSGAGTSNDPYVLGIK